MPAADFPGMLSIKIYVKNKESVQLAQTDQIYTVRLEKKLKLKCEGCDPGADSEGFVGGVQSNPL